MFNSNVQPRRRIRPRTTAWHCTCQEPAGSYRLNDAQLTRCPVCGVARHNVPDGSEILSATAGGGAPGIGCL